VKIELVDGVGHFIADERPDLVLERALAFFATE
jgi:pimeloyl-ACP methyl ester carboxylesterase